MFMNLVLGVVLIGIGSVLGFLTLPYFGITVSLANEIMVFLIITVPFFVGGGLFLRKLDNHRKREKLAEK